MTHHVERVLIVFGRIADSRQLYHDVSIVHRLLQPAAEVGVVNTGIVEARKRGLEGAR